MTTNFSVRDDRLGSLLNVDRFNIDGVMAGTIVLDHASALAHADIAANIPGSLTSDNMGVIPSFIKLQLKAVIDLNTEEAKRQDVMMAFGFQMAFGWSVLLLELKTEADKILVNRCTLNGEDVTASVCNDMAGGSGLIQHVIAPSIATAKAILKK